MANETPKRSRETVRVIVAEAARCHGIAKEKRDELRKDPWRDDGYKKALEEVAAAYDAAADAWTEMLR